MTAGAPAPPSSQFLRLISHELRTPLTGIRGYCDVLGADRTGPLTDTQRHMLTMLSSCVHRLDSLVDDLLLLSSVDAGLYGLVVEDLDVNRACEHAVRAHNTSARPDEPVVSPALAPGPCVVQADPRQLEHLLAALLNYTTGYFAAAAELLLTTAPAAGGVQVAVFGPQSAHGTGEDSDLAGLGLAVVRAIAEEHGGTVTVRPSAGQTVLRVELPRTARPSERLRVRARRRAAPQPTPQATPEATPEATSEATSQATAEEGP